MDSLSEKMTTSDVCFSVRAVKDLFSEPLMERGMVRKLYSNVKWCYSSHLSPLQLLHLRLKPTNSTCTPTSKPAMAFDDEIIPAQFKPSLEARSTFYFVSSNQVKIVYTCSHCNKYIDILRATKSIHFKHLRKNEWLCENKRRIRILFGVVASTQPIAEQIARAGPEGHLVLGDALLCFFRS